MDGEDYEPGTLSGLQLSIQRYLSEGRSPFAVLSPFKRQLETPEQYSSQHQQILFHAVTQEFNHLQGPSDLNSRVFSFSGVDIRSISEHQFKISNGPVTIFQEPQKRGRVVLIPFKLYFFTDTAAHLLSKFEALFCRN